MGRYINCKVNSQIHEVYKYVLGSQSSEMYRISTELGIGEYHLIGYVHNEDEEYSDSGTIEYIDEPSEDVEGDILILMRSDIPKLTEQISLLKAGLYNREDEEEFYIAMIESIRNFMNEHSQLDKFTFIGEF